MSSTRIATWTRIAFAGPGAIAGALLIMLGIVDLRARETQLRTALIRTSVLASLAADGQMSCPACLQPLSVEARQHVQDSLAQHGGAAGADEQREVTAVRRRIAALEQFIGDANPQALRLEWDSIAQDERQIYAKGNEIKEIDAQIADVSQPLRNLVLSLFRMYGTR